ncbi:unnamed protein product [Amoebophrya sp. A120]|nr:unnamed protein product [Amoebophrya sp. A120]|eukprot:GSA120T00010898001.1
MPAAPAAAADEQQQNVPRATDRGRTLLSPEDSSLPAADDPGGAAGHVQHQHHRAATPKTRSHPPVQIFKDESHVSVVRDEPVDDYLHHAKPKNCTVVAACSTHKDDARDKAGDEKEKMTPALIHATAVLFFVSFVELFGYNVISNINPFLNMPDMLGTDWGYISGFPYGASNVVFALLYAYITEKRKFQPVVEVTSPSQEHREDSLDPRSTTSSRDTNFYSELEKGHLGGRGEAGSKTMTKILWTRNQFFAAFTFPVRWAIACGFNFLVYFPLLILAVAYKSRALALTAKAVLGIGNSWLQSSGAGLCTSLHSRRVMTFWSLGNALAGIPPLVFNLVYNLALGHKGYTSELVYILLSIAAFVIILAYFVLSCAVRKNVLLAKQVELENLNPDEAELREQLEQIEDAESPFPSSTSAGIFIPTTEQPKKAMKCGDSAHAVSRTTGATGTTPRDVESQPLVHQTSPAAKKFFSRGEQNCENRTSLLGEQHDQEDHDDIHSVETRSTSTIQPRTIWAVYADDWPMFTGMFFVFFTTFAIHPALPLKFKADVKPDDSTDPADHRLCKSNFLLLVIGCFSVGDLSGRYLPWLWKPKRGWFLPLVGMKCCLVTLLCFLTCLYEFNLAVPFLVNIFQGMFHAYLATWAFMEAGSTITHPAERAQIGPILSTNLLIGIFLGSLFSAFALKPINVALGIDH